MTFAALVPFQGLKQVEEAKPVSQLVSKRDLRRGDGPTVAIGDVVTFEFIASVATGKEIANTYKRGLPFTLQADPKGEALSAALIGMRETGEREVAVIFGGPGIPGVVPSGERLIIWLKIDAVQRGVSAKANLALGRGKTAPAQKAGLDPNIFGAAQVWRSPTNPNR